MYLFWFAIKLKAKMLPMRALGDKKSAFGVEYLVGHGLRWDVEATEIAKTAWFIAKDGAWPAIEIVSLNAIVRILAVAEKARVGVRLPPYGDDANAVERREVHGGGVHREHDVEVGHQSHLVGEGHDSDHDVGAVAAFGELEGMTFLGFAAAEEE